MGVGTKLEEFSYNHFLKLLYSLCLYCFSVATPQFPSVCLFVFCLFLFVFSHPTETLAGSESFKTRLLFVAKTRLDCIVLEVAKKGFVCTPLPVVVVVVCPD